MPDRRTSEGDRGTAGVVDRLRDRLRARRALAVLGALGAAAVALAATLARTDASVACVAAARATDRDASDLQMRVGQMLMVGMDGAAAEDGTVPVARELIARGELGGVLLLGRNLGTPDEIRALTASLAPDDAPLPPLIAIDQEGGRVQRMREEQGAATIPSAARLAEMGEAEAARAYAVAARDLAAAGVNVNFGPVVDLELEPLNPVIVGLDRSYGSEPGDVVPFASAFIEAHRAEGIATALKHFPGHGSSLADSHEGFTDITATWDAVELEPFRALAGHADMVMTGHLYHAGLTGADGHPVTLAPGTIDALLRGELDYDGVVVTDDLDMGAIAENYEFEEAVRMAVSAGNDLLLFSAPTRAEGHVPVLARDAICDGLAEGEIPVRRVDEAYGRLVALKGRMAGV